MSSVQLRQTVRRAFHGSRGRCLQSTAVWVTWLGAVLYGAVCCVSADAGDAAVAGEPVVAVLYYPYGKGLARKIATPVPDYQGWTDERMERDIGRMRDASIDRVLVHVDVDRFRDTYRRERYKRFLELIEVYGGRLAGTFWLASNSASDAVLREFTRWHAEAGIGAMSCHYRAEGQPVVLLGQEFASCSVYHPALLFCRTAGPGAKWSLDGVAGERAWVRPDGKFAVVRPGLAPEGGRSLRDRDWPLPRRRGKPLAEALRELAGKRPAVVIIRSWNDFSAGDFVEPNSLDGKRMLKALTTELRRLRDAYREVAP